MKTVLKKIITSRVVILALINCLLFLGCMRVIDQITEEKIDTDTQAEFGPVAGNSRVPYTHPPFPEPSLKKLVAELKAELGIQNGDINVEDADAASTLYNANYQFYTANLMGVGFTSKDIDSWIKYEVHAWIERKKRVIANPELLWTPGFVLPPRGSSPNDSTGYPLGKLYDYRVEYGVDFPVSEEQKKRIHAIRDEISTKQSAGTMTAEERRQLRRKRQLINVEQADALTAAKLFLQGVSSSIAGSISLELSREYAERAFRENPDSVEALHIWVLCQETVKQRETGYRRMLEEFPNSAIAHQELALLLYYDLSRPEEALIHIQKAIQLDSRIPRYNYLLAECYGRTGEYEKALAVYQGLPIIIEAEILYLSESFSEYIGKVYQLRMQNKNGNTVTSE